MIYYNILDYSNGIVTFSIPNGVFDPEKSFDCGQCFMWYRLHSVSGTFKGVVGSKLLYLKYVSKSDDFDTFQLTEHPNYLPSFLEYLGLNDDYTPLLNSVLSDYEKHIVLVGKGIRILHQDPWETIISFIISQRNSIPKIKKSIDNLCTNLGSKKSKRFELINSNEDYYIFPTPKVILDDNYTKLNQCSLGYRAEYIYLAAKEYVENPQFFKSLLNKSRSSDEIISDLCTLKGIGPKVSNCIALFGYNRLDVFPIDVWIQRILNKQYPNGIDISKYNSLSGLLQQYMFYAERYSSYGIL